MLVIVGDCHPIRGGRNLNFTEDRRAASGMAGATIIVDAPGSFRIGWVAFAGIGLVLVIVMAEVLGGVACLMLAIDANCRPTQLERQKDKQQN